MRPYGSAKKLEARRLKAMALRRKGLSLHEVARRVGSHASSVLRWERAWVKSGAKGLKSKPVPGRPARLTERQKQRLAGYLLKGARAHGYRTDLWTTQRIADVIEQRFGVRYHRDHVGRLLHRLGWSHQKPARRALERNEERIAEWKRVEWPRVKKTPHA